MSRNRVDLSGKGIMVDVYAFGGGNIYKKTMLYEDWVRMPRVSGFRYLSYQLGFGQYKDVIEI